MALGTVAVMAVLWMTAGMLQTNEKSLQIATALLVPAGATLVLGLIGMVVGVAVFRCIGLFGRYTHNVVPTSMGEK